jgi:hypothetical protein
MLHATCYMLHATCTYPDSHTYMYICTCSSLLKIVSNVYYCILHCLLYTLLYSTLPHYHITTLPHYHTTTLPHYHTTTLPHYHTTTLPLYIYTQPCLTSSLRVSGLTSLLTPVWQEEKRQRVAHFMSNNYSPTLRVLTHSHTHSSQSHTLHSLTHTHSLVTLHHVRHPLSVRRPLTHSLTHSLTSPST